MQKALKAEGHAAKNATSKYINFQNMNKPYRMSPHEVFELWLKNTVCHSKKKTEGGGA